MRPFRNLLALMLLLYAGTSLAQNPPAPVVPKPPLVLLGGTLIDVTDWGRSALDQQNSIVIIENGKITLYKSVGLSVQDACAAARIYDLALQRGLGTAFELQ